MSFYKLWKTDNSNPKWLERERQHMTDNQLNWAWTYIWPVGTVSEPCRHSHSGYLYYRCFCSNVTSTG